MPHASCWVAWPSDASLWQEQLAPARTAWVQMARAIASGETLEVLAPDAENEDLARAALEGVDARLHRVPFGDIWLRDTAPIFIRKATGEVASARFGFNGWGGKYVLEHDGDVAARIAVLAGVREFATPWVLEGGSIDVDGQGTCLTTRQCLLNKNRNPKLDARSIEGGLFEQLGIERTVWLGDGLQNDHTDGHVDNIARFVGPSRVLCMRPNGADDPNRAVLEAIHRDLSQARDGNRVVVMPAYGKAADDEAARMLQDIFPGRSVVPIDARALLSGGGAFHCITQQVPR
jgi:agmatine deiminase